MPFKWYVKPGNTSIINSVPERFVITELIGEKQRIITLYDSLKKTSTQQFCVIDAMTLADSILELENEFEPRNFMEQPD